MSRQGNTGRSSKQLLFSLTDWHGSKFCSKSRKLKSARQTTIKKNLLLFKAEHKQVTQD